MAGERDRNRLLETVMTIILQNAGAERGVLLIPADEELVPAAEARLAAGDPEVFLCPASDVGSLVATRVVDYVRRTRTSLIASDLSADERFARDTYVRERRPRSTLCTPLIAQDRLCGILYLENNLLAGTFTAQRQDLVQVLTSQAAISLEHARLYAEMKAQLAQRERAKERLSAVASGTAAATGGDFFRLVVRYLAEALHTRYAFVTKCSNPRKTRVRTLAFLVDGEFVENIEYDLAGTPCADVIAGDVCYYPDGLAQRFPKESGLDSYFGVPVKDSGGTILGHIAVLDTRAMHRDPDDTVLLEIFGTRVGAELERLRAMDSLARLQRHNELILNAAGEGIYGVDADGNTTFLNPAGAHMLGWPPQEVLGTPMHDTHHHTRADGSPYPRDECPVYAALRDKEVHYVDGEVFWHRNGSSFPVEYTSTPILEDGEIKGAVVVFRDVSERRSAEEARRQLEEKRRLAAIGQFASMIVHEIRNPLSTIGMALEYLNKADQPNGVIKRLSLATHENQRLQNMLGDILLFAKPQQLSMTRFDLSDLMRETVSGFNDLPCEEQRTLLLDSTPAGLLVDGDRDQLKQVFINLLLNACQAIAPQETVKITLSPDENRRWTRVAINNPGNIPEQTMARMTEPFFTTKPHGTGLGLAIVKRIVDAHSGNLTIRCDAHEGVTVSVALPATT